MKAFQTFRPLAAFAACLALSIPAAAAPFAEWLHVPVPGGGTVEIWGEGDEYDAWFETADGLALRVNDAAGRYEYVDLDETTGAFVGTGILLGDEAGNFVINAYPISVHPVDIVTIFVTVIAVGWLAVWYPVRRFTTKIE